MVCVNILYKHEVISGCHFLTLPGCLATGSSRSEALYNLQSAFDEFIEAHLEWGTDIAEPERVPSGQLNIEGWETVKKEAFRLSGSGGVFVQDPPVEASSEG